MSTLFELDSARLDAALRRQSAQLGYILYRYGKTQSYEYAMTAASLKEAIEHNKRTRNALRKVDMIVNLDEALTRARGVCPCCHLVLPYNGICDCGYIKNDITDVAGAYESVKHQAKKPKKFSNTKQGVKSNKIRQYSSVHNKYAALLAKLR